jgi:protein phosphatase
LAGKVKQHVDFAIAQSRGGRENQEDFCAVWADGTIATAVECSAQGGSSKKELIAVLCDGMGGHNAGEVASQVATRAFLDAIKRPAHGAAAPTADLPNACEAANNALSARINQDCSLRGMGTTLVGARVLNSALSWVSVGDSHLYLFRRGQITKLNDDHSMKPVLDRMVRTNIISPEEARNHPDRNALRSAISGGEVALIDRGGAPVPLRKGDAVVIASDGLDTLADHTIWKMLKPRLFRSARSLASSLVEACLKSGGPHQDNTTVTILLVR